MAGKLAVIGAGLMGSGIAQVSAQAGWDVVLRDVTDEALNRGLDGIKASYDRFVSKGKLEAADAEAALARITATTD
ncbi:3-hydroxyacyl-CoA dehydrogenase NAD-binding domain-containing protein, partial [Streptomyces sp. NPDC054766]